MAKSTAHELLKTLVEALDDYVCEMDFQDEDEAKENLTPEVIRAVKEAAAFLRKADARARKGNAK